MKGILNKFDPDLGAKFSQDHGGFVMQRAPKSPVKSKRQESDLPPGLDAQQQHDWLNSSDEEDKRFSPHESKIQPAKPWSDDPNRPETEEEDGLETGLRRVAKYWQGDQEGLEKALNGIRQAASKTLKA
jgi:hypothetical protein